MSLSLLAFCLARSQAGKKQALALFTNAFLCNSWEGSAREKTMRRVFRWGLFSFDSGRPGEQPEEGGEFTVALTFRLVPLFRHIQLQRALRKATAAAHTHAREPCLSWQRLRSSPATFAASARSTGAALARRAAVPLIRMCLFHLVQETHLCLPLLGGESEGGGL